jgi:hypothetical protein
VTRLPRTIRLDTSDSFVFAAAAAPGEWAVSGAFVFQGADAATLSHKSLVALRSGFLGIDSLGWSTLVEVAEASAADIAAAEAMLAQRLVTAFGCPDAATALAAAREELAFAASLCDLPLGTIVAVRRSLADGEITERFRTLTMRADRSAPVFALVQTDEPAEDVDLRKLMRDDDV